MVEQYEVVAHTADVGLNVEGKTRAEFFENAARGMLSLMTDPAKVEPARRVKIMVSATDWENLLVDWLHELLYLATVKRMAIGSVRVERIDPFILKAEVSGETFDPSRHSLYREIKAATYHGLKISESPAGLSAQIIFDI